METDCTPGSCDRTSGRGESFWAVPRQLPGISFPLGTSIVGGLFLIDAEDLLGMVVPGSEAIYACCVMQTSYSETCSCNLEFDWSMKKKIMWMS